MRNRCVRTLNSEKATQYLMYGFQVTEKMKNDLRRGGLKTDTNKWSDVFRDADVVYRFNPAKGKLDVFVGTLEQVKYASGKVRNLVQNLAVLETIDRTREEVSWSNMPNVSHIFVSSDKVGWNRETLRGE